MQHVLQSMTMLQCTETGAECVGYVSMVTLNQSPPHHTPLEKCPNTQEVSDSMARLCSFLLDCIEMKNKNGSRLKRNVEGDDAAAPPRAVY